MTHAALKDLLPADVLRQEVSMMEASLAPYSSPAYRESTERKIKAFDAAIAALSAMEGEAVAWMVERDSDPSFPRLMRTEAEADSLISYCNVNPPVTKRPLIYGDTAPPPQQAEHVHEWIIDPDLGAGSGYLYCRVCKVTRKHDSLADTHPTPSPGPQGGPIPEAVKRGEKWVVDVGPLTMDFRSSEGATAWNTLRRMISDNVFAIPPAHQPGEVGDVLADMKAWIDEGWELATPPISQWHQRLAAALAPKEDGHDR